MTKKGPDRYERLCVDRVSQFRSLCHARHPGDFRIESADGSQAR